MDQSTGGFLAYLTFVLYLFRYGISDWFHSMVEAFREGRAEVESRRSG